MPSIGFFMVATDDKDAVGGVAAQLALQVEHIGIGLLLVKGVLEGEDDAEAG
jgi:hypothetical protein